jgi:homoserine acetyltransferase
VCCAVAELHGVETTALITIKTYPTPFEAQQAKIVLDAAGISCLVLGVGVSMEGGMEGVQLQVLPDQVDEALDLLRDS